MHKEIINPDTVVRPFSQVELFKSLKPTFSQAIKVRDAKTIVFISGQVAIDSLGNIVGKGDAAAQTRQILENIKAILEAAGGSIKDIVKVTVYLTDMEYFNDVHKIRMEYFKEDPPASTLVQVSKLVIPDLLVEIEAIAITS